MLLDVAGRSCKQSHRTVWKTEWFAKQGLFFRVLAFDMPTCCVLHSMWHICMESIFWSFRQHLDRSASRRSHRSVLGFEIIGPILNLRTQKARTDSRIYQARSTSLLLTTSHTAHAVYIGRHPGNGSLEMRRLSAASQAECQTPELSPNSLAHSNRDSMFARS